MYILKELCFIVNIDHFFHSHRRPLQKRLALTFDTSVIAGDSGIQTDYVINEFEIKSRIPTLRGIFQLYQNVRRLDKDTVLIVVTPVMIILCHFLLRKRRKIIYNFSGLGFLRDKSATIRNIIFHSLKIYPVCGKRVFVVQNSDDYEYLNQVLGSKKSFHLELIPGSGYEDENDILHKLDSKEVTIGYVGRVRKDKGVLDLVRAVSQFQKNGYNISLKIWGNLDDESRHGFNTEELEELKSYSQYLKGFSKNKNEIFRSFNWFCLPSNGEGLSKAAIEASSFALPLLLSDVQGNRDMIRGNGFLFEYGDVDNLKKALTDILNLSNEEVDVMSRTSRQIFEKYWTMDAVYSKWIEILTKYY